MIYAVNNSQDKNNLDFKNQNGSDRKSSESQVQLYIDIWENCDIDSRYQILSEKY